MTRREGYRLIQSELLLMNQPFIPSYPQEKIVPTLRFLKRNGRENCSNFFEYLNRPEVFQLVEFAMDFHKEDKRKVTGDPYVKHLLYSAYLSYISPEFKKYSPSDKKVFVAANLLHDSIEMRRKVNSSYGERECYQQLIDCGLAPNYS
jgi:hypothetical protein